MKTTATLERLKETHWHQSDCQTWNTFRDSIARVQDSILRLWAFRIERKGQTPHLPHVHLFVIDVTHYAKRADGVSAPDGQQFSFIVAADNSKAASKRAEQELTAHGFNAQEWAIGATVAPLVLIANN